MFRHPVLGTCAAPPTRTVTPSRYLPDDRDRQGIRLVVGSPAGRNNKTCFTGIDVNRKLVSTCDGGREVHGGGRPHLQGGRLDQHQRPHRGSNPRPGGGGAAQNLGYAHQPIKWADEFRQLGVRANKDVIRELSVTQL
eukprot:5128925-Pyramimonas_sp.AAC.1